jgi:ABC-type glycerol-3-phosphate transport system substrate-binding protein
MTRVLAAALMLSALAACSSSGDSSAPWYESGDATYDSLKAATDACKAKGGEFKLKPGGDPTHLSDYVCQGAKGS